VVTIEVDPGLADRARTSLAAAGYAGVAVVCGDGAAGVPARAPYDRVIVTAGVWDLAPQWLAQLRRGGRIVAPVSVRGIQLAVAFEDAGTHWVSRQACRCQFIRMTGPSAGPEAIVRLGPQPGLCVLVTDGAAPEAWPLYEALSGRPTDVRRAGGLRVGGVKELADLDLWLALTEPGLSRLSMTGGQQASQDRRGVGSRMPLGGFARYDSSGRLGVAALALPPAAAPDGRHFEVAVSGHGPGGAALAGHLAGRAAVWDALGRPGTGTLELAAHPAGTRAEAAEGSVIIRRPDTVLVARWPGAAQ
jgi:protein-L-isoaspartate(D-aspartate) O-methyltransferase